MYINQQLDRKGARVRDSSKKCGVMVDTQVQEEANKTIKIETETRASQAWSQGDMNEIKIDATGKSSRHKKVSRHHVKLGMS